MRFLTLAPPVRFIRAERPCSATLSTCVDNEEPGIAVVFPDGGRVPDGRPYALISSSTRSLAVRARSR